MRVQIFYGSAEHHPCGGYYYYSAFDKANDFAESIEKGGGEVLNIEVRSDDAIVMTYRKGSD